MNALNREELQAVLAHELTHVINKDVRTMVIASVFAGIISLMAQAVYRAILWGGAGRRASRDNNKGAGLFILVAIAAMAIGYVLALVIRMTLSRSREYVADAGAVELTKNPDAMISALRKIDGRSTISAPEQVQGMFIENRQSGIGGLFATHPPIAKRIAALVKFAGGREALAVEPTPTGPWG
jgi:heat shock protein HtpX